ncbi:MAG: nitroreductase family protein [Deltaproteobacteria bacterium]|nr:nitroreductase family protein [Deltaproteobacteria bacterium]
MTVQEAVKGRRSVRRFLEKQVSDDAVGLLKEALRWAPSAGNLQARKFYFVFCEELRVKIANHCFGQMFIQEAPLVVVACGDLSRISPYGKRGRELYVIQDVAAAVENLMLQAHELGLGSVWVGAFDEAGVAKTLDMPDSLRPLAVVPVGWPGHKPIAPKRDLADEAVSVIKGA